MLREAHRCPPPPTTLPQRCLPPPQTPSAAGDPLFDELWHACAGPLVTVPRVGDLVFYFPQGRIEQVEASMNQVAGNQMRLYDLPSKLLCRVINVELKIYQLKTLHGARAGEATASGLASMASRREGCRMGAGHQGGR